MIGDESNKSGDESTLDQTENRGAERLVTPEHEHGHSHGHEHAAYPQTEVSDLAASGTRGAICPRCGSWEVVAGNFLDGLGQTIRFGLMYRQRAPGVSGTDAPPVLALYCNACGEVTLTLGG